MKKQVTAIYRAQRFSPNSIENDRLILKLTAKKLAENGFTVVTMTEEELENGAVLPHSDLVLTMTRSEKATQTLANALQKGEIKACINTPAGIETCSDRLQLDRIMREHNIPVPARSGAAGVWLKRAKGSAEVKEDVVYCATEKDLNDAIKAFASRGITETLQQAHEVGDLVKFYGVAGTDFFHFLYPTDTGKSKFGDEKKNGIAKHYPFNADALRNDTQQLANAIKIAAYGGDAIIKADGSYSIIDFNDWPSFSSCREDAAKAIVSVAEGLIFK